MDATMISNLAFDWYRDFLAIVEAHEGLAYALAAAVLVALVLSRSLLVLIAASFLCIAAAVGSEPVENPLKRAVFVVGTVAAVMLVSLAMMALRGRLSRTQRALKESEARQAKLRDDYEAEVRWRHAIVDMEPNGEDGPKA